MNRKKTDHDIIDQDLYEELDEDELLEMLEQGQTISTKPKKEREKYRVPKWLLWLIAITLFINAIAILPKTFSIPAIDFLITSARLSSNATISEYKEAVVVVQADQKKGTGFSISSDGTIITNHHVIESSEQITVAYPELGLLDAEVTSVDADIDLAILQVDQENLPFLDLASQSNFDDNESIYFIGNPLQFNGIANQGTMLGYIRLQDREKQVLMIDAPVYHGSSGSPVINDQGKVIGVIFATMNHEQYGKIGLAIPIDEFYRIK